MVNFSVKLSGFDFGLNFGTGKLKSWAANFKEIQIKSKKYIFEFVVCQMRE